MLYVQDCGFVFLVKKELLCVWWAHHVSLSQLSFRRTMRILTVAAAFLISMRSRPTLGYPSDESIQMAKDFLDEHPVFDGHNDLSFTLHNYVVRKKSEPVHFWRHLPRDRRPTKLSNFSQFGKRVELHYCMVYFFSWTVYARCFRWGRFQSSKGVWCFYCVRKVSFRIFKRAFFSANRVNDTFENNHFSLPFFFQRTTTWAGSTSTRTWPRLSPGPAPLTLTPTCPGSGRAGWARRYVGNKIFFCFTWGSPEPQSFGPNFVFFRETLAILWL